MVLQISLSIRVIIAAGMLTFVLLLPLCPCLLLIMVHPLIIILTGTLACTLHHRQETDLTRIPLNRIRQRGASLQSAERDFKALGFLLAR